MQQDIQIGEPDPAVLIIGCGNLLRGDDGVGPRLVSRLLDLGLPQSMRAVDGGTAGLAVVDMMDGIRQVAIVDACTGVGEPGYVLEVPGESLAVQAPAVGNLHDFRFDHAIAFGRLMLKERFPERVTVFLIEAGQFTPGAPLSEAVARSMESLCRELLRRYGENSS